MPAPSPTIPQPAAAAGLAPVELGGRGSDDGAVTPGAQRPLVQLFVPSLFSVIDAMMTRARDMLVNTLGANQPEPAAAE